MSTYIVEFQCIYLPSKENGIYSGWTADFGRYQEVALTEPVAITRNGRERVVILSVDEYHRLKRRDR